MAEQSFDKTRKRNQLDCKDATDVHHLPRDKYAAIADDTLKKFQAGLSNTRGNHRNVNLQHDLRFSIENTIVYTEDDLITTTLMKSSSSPVYEIRHCTTLQAAESLASEIDDDNRIGILNFASAKNPGGGFLKGSNAQEESIARSSSLYLALSQDRIFPQFYGYHRREKNGLYTHRIIYSPRITIIKDDNGKMLSSPYHVGIVTCAAPNASICQDIELTRQTMKERIRCLLTVFQMHRHDVVVLGAFGCGVFKNDPREVALAFREHLQSDEFRNVFSRIIFAIFDADMHHVFEEVFAISQYQGK
ncbi:unnamed protein product [Adineta ricciae]|uniref:Microbial-type PARG catalytic domain-containing protein n=1 Tax=Adineta ricciae TaxID=249248 RepID=A0A814VMB2_ADIRI|nr:unnamed protein product [Adineta ricciae]CAF1643309.1 unnamed protein product [Adineta ricciae]